MSFSRNILLWASQNEYLKRRVPRLSFVRRAVGKFMPGEDVRSALDAAVRLRDKGIPTIFTRLGENISTDAEATSVKDHYLDVLDQIKARGLDTHISTKLTQLGLDLDPELAFRNMLAITQKAASLGNFTWIDMESTPYVDVTLDIYRRIHDRSRNIGVCLQAYLHRTRKDMESLYSRQPAIRMVKGAYKEPPELAIQKKRGVDENYFELCRDYLRSVDRSKGYLGYGTHDMHLIRRITEEAESMGLGTSAPEFQMLYGIKASEQEHLVTEGYKVRVLIAYGDFWYPWYVRRLAERPANVWFVVKNMFGS